MSLAARSSAGVRDALRDTLLPTLRRVYGGDLRAAWRDTQPMAYVEMAIGFGVLVALNLLFFRETNWGYFDVNPHPFWLVILPIAARYGAAPGYVVGGLAAVLYLFFLVFQPRSVFAVDILSTQAILPPVLFIVVGAALGELREAHKRAHKELAARYDTMENDLQDVAQRYLAAVEINREMQRRIVSQTSTVTTLYQAAKALEQLEVHQLSPAVLELVTTFVEAESCALYLNDGGRFVLAVGRPEPVSRPTELDTRRGLLGQVLAERRTVTIRDVLPEATPSQIVRQPLLVATPLLGQNQEVIGILTVERMPFLRFTPSTVKIFTLLGDWASTAFQTALRFQQTRDRNVEDELTGAYSYSYLVKRLDEEFARARTYALPLTVLALRIDDYAAIPPVRLPSVLQALALVFRRHLRQLDILGKYAMDDVFLAALPHVSLEEGHTIAERIRREVTQFGFKPFDDDRSLEVSYGLTSLTPGVASAQELVDRAVSALRAAEDAAVLPPVAH